MLLQFLIKKLEVILRIKEFTEKTEVIIEDPE